MSIPPTPEYGTGPAGRFSQGGPSATEPLPPQPQYQQGGPQYGQEHFHGQHDDGGNGVGQRAQNVAQTLERVGWSPETKPFFLTSEFWVMTLLAIGTLIAAASDDGFGSHQAWTLVTVLGAAYILARGFSRAGTRYGSQRKAPFSQSFGGGNDRNWN